MNNIELWQGDCLELIKNIPDGSVDLILTDPPYGTVKNIGNENNIKHGMKGKTNWDTRIDIIKMFEECNRILRKNGCLVLFGQEPYTNILINNCHNNTPFSYKMFWVKNHFANSLIARKAPVNYIEEVCIFFKKHNKHDFEGIHPIREYAKKVMNFIDLNLKEINKKLGHRRSEHFFYINSTQFGLCTEKTYNELVDVFNIDKMEGFKNFKELEEINKKFRDELILKMTNDFPKVFNLQEGKKYKSNILEYRKDKGNFHPTQKPVKLLEDLIYTYTRENDLVLDFTMGSGSTGVACKNLNRKFIGIELDEKYFEIAKERINKTV